MAIVYGDFSALIIGLLFGGEKSTNDANLTSFYVKSGQINAEKANGIENAW
jgi:hypothetical protein